MLVQNADSLFNIALKDSSNNSIDFSNANIRLIFKTPSKKIFEKPAIFFTLDTGPQCTVILSKEDLSEAGFYEYQIIINTGSKIIKSNIQNTFVQESLPEVIVNGG